MSAALGPLVTWWITKRKSSGRINTTEANDLWEESSKIRDELRNDLKDARLELETVRADNSRLKLENFSLQNEVDYLKRQLRGGQQSVRLISQNPELVDLKEDKNEFPST